MVTGFFGSFDALIYAPGISKNRITCLSDTAAASRSRLAAYDGRCDAVLLLLKRCPGFITSPPIAQFALCF